MYIFFINLKIYSRWDPLQGSGVFFVWALARGLDANAAELRQGLRNMT